METFLSEVARKILSDIPHDLDQATVVFNNRRPGIFLRKELAQQKSNTFFLPKIIGIDELVQALNPTEIIPNEFLMFELYGIHCEIEESPTSFDEFIPMAETMLSDFSAIDLYNVDAEQLFNNISDAKAIELWTVGGDHLTEMQQRYLTFYRNLYRYYTLLHHHLEAEGKAYQGMAYRKVAENIDSMINVYPCQQVYFVGFNALSVCEEKIVQAFIKRGRGQLIVDGDAYYYNEQILNGSPLPQQEAGYFLRKNRLLFKNLPPFKSHFADGEKSITIVSCPENLLQTKYAGDLLEQLHSNGSSAQSIEQTALVLADEKLLIPMLNALPESVHSVNITMGFPFTGSSAHELMLKCISLHQRAKNNRFLHKDVIDIVSDSIIKKVFGIKCLPTIVNNHLQQQQMAYITTDDLRTVTKECPEEYDAVAPLFGQDTFGVSELLTTCHNFVATLCAHCADKIDLKEQESLGNLLKIIDYINSLQATKSYIDTLDSLQRIYQKIAKRHNISFYGEPLSGLQLLGMLETRNLDFERVIILSTNEGILPSGKKDNTLIPYDLKRCNQFHIPSYEEHDAVYAYHFYRLLQRAKETYLVYHTESESMGKGEPSRFLLQIEHELTKKYPNIHISRKSIATNTQLYDGIKIIEPVKSDVVIQRLQQLAKEGLSPSALNMYRACPLRFYYEYILRLRTADQIEETLQTNDLGTFIHNVLEKIHTIPKKTFLSRTRLEEALSKIDTLLTNEVKSQYRDNIDTTGQNDFLLNVAKNQISHLLRNEIQEIDEGHRIEIVLNESAVAHTLTIPLGNSTIAVNIKGTADRIDRIDGQLRIIDYKSGSVKSEDLIYKDGKKGPSDKWFQVMLYAWAYYRSHHLGESVVSAIYPLKNLHSGLLPAVWNDIAVMNKEAIDRFEEMLTNIVSELYNPAIPFTFHYDKNENACKYCPFKKDCNLDK